MKLTSEAVQSIMRTVLYKPGEVTNIPEDDIVPGLVRAFAFHPERLKEQKKNIDELLLQLNHNFRRDEGGGWSFLNGAIDANGMQWGEQRDVEALVCLGIGVGSAAWLMKEFAAELPGSVPFFQVFPEEKENK